jgi:hypothetical protein
MSPIFTPLRKNRSVRFDFCGPTVLLGCRGFEVSFNTAVGGGALVFAKGRYKLIEVDPENGTAV